MATLSISEYSTLPSIAEALQEPAVLRQRVSIGLDPERSGKFHKSTRLIRIAADAACWLTIGGDDADPAKDGEYFPAGTIERRGVPEGGAFLVAVVGSNRA